MYIYGHLFSAFDELTVAISICLDKELVTVNMIYTSLSVYIKTHVDAYLPLLRHTHTFSHLTDCPGRMHTVLSRGSQEALYKCQ